jgi:major membrane immunogen (membrane-anchored lipoprotein)
MFAITIGLAMLMAAPLSVMAQVTEPAPGPDEPIYPDDPGYNYTDPYWYYWPEQGGFDYDDGVANGTYVDFLLNETTGTISDYTAKLVDYNYYYPMVYAEGDRNGGNGYGYGYGSIPEPTEYVVTFFDSIEFEDFTPNGHPGVFGQSMVFLGENVMMTFGDYEWSSIYFQFGEDNGTMRFEVPEGFEINKTPYYYALYDITDEEKMDIDYATGMEGSGSASAPAVDGMYEPDYWARWTYDQVYLRSGNVSCSIWVDRGTINVTGNTITVETYPGAYVSTSSWIEYAWQYQYTEPWFVEEAPEGDKGAIAGALESGLMAAVGYLFHGENAQYSDSRAMNDPSFKLEFQNVEQNRFQVRVQSEIKTGRIVTLNVNKGALEAESVRDLDVLLDGEKVKACSSMEELVDMQGGTKAGYYMVSGNSQNSVFVYVPHFSVHVITVGLAESIFGTVALPAIVAAVFIAVAVAMIVRRGKRNKDEL